MVHTKSCCFEYHILRKETDVSYRELESSRHLERSETIPWIRKVVVWFLISAIYMFNARGGNHIYTYVHTLNGSKSGSMN